MDEVDASWSDLEHFIEQLCGIDLYMVSAAVGDDLQGLSFSILRYGDETEPLTFGDS